MKKCTSWPRCGCIIRGYIQADGSCDAPVPTLSRDHRAIYVGPPVDNGNIFLNHGITGEAASARPHTYNEQIVYFLPDGQKRGTYLKRKDLHFPKD